MPPRGAPLKAAMFTLTKAQMPGKSITIVFNGEDVSHKCSRAYVPREPGVEGDGWVDLRWDFGAPPERFNGKVLWFSS